MPTLARQNRMTHRSLARFLIIAAVASATVFVGSGTALACSCLAPNAEALLASSDGAFVGTLLERPQPPVGVEFSSGDPAPSVFQIEESYKGELRSPITVISAISGATCGFELSEGDTASIFVNRSGDHWEGGLCSTMGPEALAESSFEPESFESGAQDDSALARWVFLSVVALGLGVVGWNRWARTDKPIDD